MKLKCGFVLAHLLPWPAGVVATGALGAFVQRLTLEKSWRSYNFVLSVILMYVFSIVESIGVLLLSTTFKEHLTFEKLSLVKSLILQSILPMVLFTGVDIAGYVVYGFLDGSSAIVFQNLRLLTTVLVRYVVLRKMPSSLKMVMIVQVTISVFVWNLDLANPKFPTFSTGTIVQAVTILLASYASVLIERTLSSTAAVHMLLQLIVFACIQLCCALVFYPIVTVALDLPWVGDIDYRVALLAFIYSLDYIVYVMATKLCGVVSLNVAGPMAIVGVALLERFVSGKEFGVAKIIALIYLSAGILGYSLS